MLTVRASNGSFTSEQFRALADAAQKLGAGYADLTTRQDLRMACTADQVAGLRQKLEIAGLMLAADGAMPELRAAVCPMAGISRRACAEGCEADHVGVHAQTPGDRYAVGLPVPVGRITSEQMKKLADMAGRYVEQSASTERPIRLTARQHVVLVHLPEESVEKVLAGARDVGLPVSASPWRRSFLVCTERGETHLSAQAQQLLDHLEARVPMEPPVRVRVEGCAQGCTAPQLADIALIRVETGAYDLFVGGHAGPPPVFSRPMASQVTITDASRRLERMLRQFQKGRKPVESFHAWCVRLGDVAVAELLTEDSNQPSSDQAIEPLGDQAMKLLDSSIAR